MATVATRRPVMTLYSEADCPLSHRVRIVLEEKSITADVISVDKNNLPEDLIDLNPYSSVPTLVDRDLVLYNSQIIVEYLDERYPHPPLMPVDPVSRARSRMMLHRIELDWYSLLGDLTGSSNAKASAARKTIQDGLTLIAPIFVKKLYFMSDDFSLIDCSLAPLLWRLSHYGIKLPAQAKPVQEYADRLFAREAFQASLTEAEKELR
ncbi:Stringent starvation protein A [hydrothermal vent metagenome]|uniref:Stringent starvation protein A n=1 Tax=hydrothermal vent metagenome TaxID=652676 RepID=A0A3B0Z813_9ZZZZ